MSEILVIGDLMLDIYSYGKCDRISPEAPVPVFDFKKYINIPGGASNVAMNLNSFGNNTSLIGVIGNDDNGQTLKKELNKIPRKNIAKKSLLRNGLILRVYNNKQIIDSTKDLCVAYKLNTAFYETNGINGWK